MKQQLLQLLGGTFPLDQELDIQERLQQPLWNPTPNQVALFSRWTSEQWKEELHQEAERRRMESGQFDALVLATVRYIQWVALLELTSGTVDTYHGLPVSVPRVAGEVNAVARQLLTRPYGAAILGPQSKRALPQALRSIGG